ncbi:DNA adenine methylase [Pseudomonas shirazensis]
MFRYFGSKASTASIVADIALEGFESATIADAFGGLGNIGAEFRKRGCSVTACDLLHFPNAFQHVRLVCKDVPLFSKVRAHLNLGSVEDFLVYINSQSSQSSWFVQEYALKRSFFSVANAEKIAGAWSCISFWTSAGLLNADEDKFLLVSLLNCMDAVANTAGTYYAYLKVWDRKALKDFKFQWFSGVVDGPVGLALQGDALSCLAGKNFDVLYLDPPYNARDYSRYYHLPETLSKFEELPIDAMSKCGQPIQRSRAGTQIREAMKLPYLVELISAVNWERLVIQYADGAHIYLDDMKSCLQAMGSLKIHTIPALGYQSTNGTRRHTHHVFVIDK